MLGGPPDCDVGLILVKERCGMEGSLSKCSAVLRMFDKADELTCQRTTQSPGQPCLPCLSPQSLVGSSLWEVRSL